jgi:hypothetical protein
MRREETSCRLGSRQGWRPRRFVSGGSYLSRAAGRPRGLLRGVRKPRKRCSEWIGTRVRIPAESALNDRGRSKPQGGFILCEGRKAPLRPEQAADIDQGSLEHAPILALSSALPCSGSEIGVRIQTPRPNWSDMAEQPFRKGSLWEFVH